MACENCRAWGCTPDSASEKSLKVDIYRTAQSQLFHPLTTWGSIHALRIWPWLTTFWCAICMILLANMIVDHRCQFPPDLNPYCFNTCNISYSNTCNPYKCENEISKQITLVRRGLFTSEENLVIRLHSLQKIQSIWSYFNLLKASDKFRLICLSDANSCWERHGKSAS